jgi:hypothetical protein
MTKTVAAVAALATVALDVPIVRGDTTIATVQIRKPGPGEMRGLKLVEVVHADVDTMIALLPRITVPPLIEQEVADLDLADFIECCNQVSGFLQQRGTSTVSPAA